MHSKLMFAEMGRPPGMAPASGMDVKALGGQHGAVSYMGWHTSNTHRLPAALGLWRCSSLGGAGCIKPEEPRVSS